MLSTRNILLIGAALVAQNTIGGGFGGMQQAQLQGQQNRDTRAAQQQEATRLQLSQDLVKQKDAVAKQRYQSGCIMVVAAHNKTQLTAITEGLPVIDGARNVPLSVGNIVCDSNGLTGEIVASDKGPIVGNTAFTSDRAIVATAAKRYTGTRYTMPKQ